MTVTPRQAITNAVEAELASARFYTLLADSTDVEDSRTFLSEMAESERGHARAIREAGEALLAGPLAARADAGVELVETLPDWRFADGLTLAEAYEIAIAAEHKAALYYDALSDFFEGDVQRFFVELARTEERHAEALEARRRSAGP